MTREERQRGVESITESIVIGTGTEVEMRLGYFPSSEEMTKEQPRLASHLLAIERQNFPSRPETS